MRKFLTGLMFGTMLLCSAVPTFANEVEPAAETISIDDRGTIADKQKGIIEIEYIHNKGEKNEVKLSGATITITKVADVDTDLGRFLMDAPFIEKYGYEYITEGKTSQELLNTAKDMVSIAAKSKLGNISRNTDKDGKVTFENVDAGLYLVQETGKTGVASKYYDFAPYLLSVPMVNDEGEPIVVKKTDTSVVYYVKTLPKTTTNIIPETTTPNETTPTETPPTPIAGIEFEGGMRYVVIGGVCLLCAMFGLSFLPLILKKRNKKEDN